MVKIIGVSSVDEKICAAAGRISTQSGTAMQIFEKSQDKDKNANLIGKVTASGHTSTVEHIFFNLAFENVSVVVEQFMIEFRLASFTVKSRRYVDFGDSGYFMPEIKDDAVREEFSNHVESLFGLYNKLCENGVPKEDARFVLPYCFYSNFFCSLNGRELIFVLRAMLYGRGRDTKEIYDIGVELLNQAKKIAPGVFGNFEKQYKNYSDKISLPPVSCEKKSDTINAVELLGYTQNAEELICKSEVIAQYGISDSYADEIVKQHKSEILAEICKSGRPRSLESASYTIRFNGVTLATLTHFSRHRMQTLILPKLDDTDRISYILPPTVVNAGLENEYRAAFEKTNELYKKMRAVGESETVYALLAGNTMSIVSVMNARELMLFMKLRTCSRAQWEINALAIDLLFQLRKISPELFRHYGPSCYVTGVCPEGRLTCGKANEIKEKFRG